MVVVMSISRSEQQLGIAGSAGFVRAVACFLIAAGLGLAILRFTFASPMEDGLEGALGSLALGAPVIATGVLALLALKERAILMVPAAVALIPMSFLSFSGVTLPLLVPAVMLAIGYARRSRDESISWVQTVATVWIVVMLLIAAVGALFVHQDPRQYTTPTSEWGSSDIITALEALVSLALTATSVVAGWFLSALMQSRSVQT